LFLATMLTARYSIRFIVTVLWNSSNSLPFQYVNDSSPIFNTPIILLTCGTISRGALLNWIRFNFTLEPFLPNYIKLSPLLITLLGAYLSFKISSKLHSIYIKTHLFHHFNSSIWFLHPLSSQGIIFYPLKFSHTLLKTIDMGWLELLGRQGIYKYLSRNSLIVIFLNKNRTTTHLTLISIIIIFIISLYKT
jgi:hypothetical protein